ncbi:MAG: V-type ATP synthase subunit F [bacterium]|jgi:V/A-type H+-transporting ATPase subunit F
MKFFVIGDNDTVLGFRLVGVQGRAVETREEALTALREAVENRETGVVLITEKAAAGIRDEVEARLYGLGFPLVLEIPDSSGPDPERPEIEDIVKRAIGVSI